ncbi:MarR family transcriptional regulator [Streptomyces sp. NBC_01443]|uniref:MarR family transcriptional regulator n=1 Tax=Streptomyces sp. NBC_01443 TaxID=2903868 RepID=UPI00225A016D|nr:MarR family transcriptional regulator [Streptomyces sp. NBC_01443]MCX4630456.1 MarR family transcriptional regulator [Streptomyces sp. NBC_01443]
MTTIKTYPQDRLAAQPIGYWSREAATLVISALRTSLAEEHLTQPHWWTLNHIAGAPGTWTRPALTEKLTPYDDQDTDFRAVHDDLTARGWLTESEDGTLTLTRAGEEGRLRAHARNAEVHTRYRQGIDDATYAATIDTLRRMVANLGGDGDLPS